MLSLLHKLVSMIPIIVAGLFISSIGVFLIKMAVDDAPRSGPSASDLLPGIGALVVGGLLLIAAVINVWLSLKKYSVPESNADPDRSPQ